MKTGRKIITLLAVSLLVIAVMGIIFGVKGGKDNTFSADLYFINESKTSIQSEKRDIKYEHKNDLPELVVDELAKGSSGTGLDIIPDGASWHISKKATRILVDFSDEFITEDNVKNMLSAYAVVKSLCGIDGIGAAKITVEGSELVGLDGTPIGYLTSNDIDIENEDSVEAEKSCKLYFATSDAVLTGEWRSVKRTDTAPLAESLIAELIKGPKSEGLSAVLSTETKLISVEVTDETAYVNMSRSFTEKNKGSAEKEYLAVYSVVDTLLELNGVRGVQFLIEGKKEKGFDTVDLNTFFDTKTQ